MSYDHPVPHHNQCCPHPCLLLIAICTTAILLFNLSSNQIHIRSNAASTKLLSDKAK